MPTPNNNDTLITEILKEVHEIEELLDISFINIGTIPTSSPTSSSTSSTSSSSTNSTQSTASDTNDNNTPVTTKHYVFHSQMSTYGTLSESGWEVYALGDNSELSLSLSDGALLVTESNSGSVINGSTPSATTASIYNLSDISLTQGTEYTFSITLNSSEARTITAFLLKTGGAWTVLGEMDSVAVTAGTQTLTTTFSPTEDLTAQCFMSFATDWDNTYNNTTVSISTVDVYYTTTTVPTPSKSADSANSNSSSSSTSTSNSTVTAVDIIAYAKTFIGDKYTWGGTSPTTGFDCSGFVQYVFKHFGIDLERTTYEQVTQGVSVPIDDMQPGDLVFEIGTAASPDHVGIYIGNGEIINAEDPTNGVCISQTYEVVACRNVLPVAPTPENTGSSTSSGSSDSSSTDDNNTTTNSAVPTTNTSAVTAGMYGQIVGNGGCNIYSDTNGSSIVGSLELGQRFYISEVCNNFYKISKPSTGYIPLSQTYVQTTNVTTYSQKLINFTASYEGFRSQPYQDSGGNWTVGYGHCTYGVKPAPETQAQAWAQLEQTLQSFADEIASTYAYLNMPQWQFDAVVDFCFNLGFGSFQGSDLLINMQQCCNNATIEGDFTAWSYCDGQLLQGLLRRRTAESQMFLWEEYNDN